MQHFLRHFKLAIIATGVAFVLMIVCGVLLLMVFLPPGTPNAEERAGMLGTGLATLTCVLITPFWIYGAYTSGKASREALKKTKSKSSATSSRKRRARD